MGELAQQHFGYTYRLLPNDPQTIAEQLSAGRPLLAEVRTHGLGNPRYPGYSSHYEQNGGQCRISSSSLVTTALGCG